MNAPTTQPRTRIARHHAVDTVPVVDIDATVGDLVAMLRANAYDYAGEVAITDDGKFVGVVAIEDALPKPDDHPLGDLVQADHAVVHTRASQEHAAMEALAVGQRSVAVARRDKTFVGFISPARIEEILFHEHQEDLARHGGYLTGAGEARLASEEPIGRRLWHRLPWLLLGLVGAIGMAELVAAFETQLSKEVVFAYFVPAIVYLAGAVGIQTETLVVRGMAVGANLRLMTARELVTGLLVGLILSGALMLAIALRWNNADAAVAVGVAVLAASFGASAVALALPVILRAMKTDPAFGTGPIATVLEDGITIAIYFAAIIAVTA